MHDTVNFLPGEAAVAAPLLPLSALVTPSRWPIRLLLISTLLVLLALYFSPLTWPVISFLSVLWAAYLAWQLYRLQVMAVAAIEVTQQGWRLRFSAGPWLDTDLWHLQGDDSWHPWLLSVRLRHVHSGRRLQLLLYPDSCNARDLRRLRVLLLQLS